MASRAKRKQVERALNERSAKVLHNPPVVPVIPSAFQVAIFKANELIGRTECDVSISLRNLKAVMHRNSEIQTGGSEPLGDEAYEILCCTSMLADTSGRFQATDDQVVAACNVLLPFIRVLHHRLGALAKCIMTGEAESAERRAEIEKWKLRDWLTSEDVLLLGWLIDDEATVRQFEKLIAVKAPN